MVEARRHEDFRRLGGMSLDEIAREEGVSKQRVEQICRRALWKLRRNLEAQGLALADLLPETAGGFTWPDWPE